VLLDFWATWCDPCRDEIPQFVELQNKYRDQGLQIIGVSMDDEPKPVLEFYQRFRMNYPVVMGNAWIGEAYGGVFGLPIAFVIGRDGRIYAKQAGVTDIAIFEKEVASLLHLNAHAVHSGTLPRTLAPQLSLVLRNHVCVICQQFPAQFASFLSTRSFRG
jgi:thiol-disulfide isomerase/thioredoxin